METQELVTTIKEDYAPDWSRAKILSHINRGQRRLWGQDSPQSTFFNESDVAFPVPILNTTEGTLAYEITAANLLNSAGGAVVLSKGGYTVVPRRVASVFVQVSPSSASDYDNLFYGEEFEWAGINDNWSSRLYRVSFYKIPAMTFDATGNQNCKVVFAEDPGTHDNRYYVEFYYHSINLTSEAVPLTIDGDRWGDALIDYVVGQIEMSQYGRSERLDRFERFWMKKFRSNQFAGITNRKPLQMPVKECL